MVIVVPAQAVEQAMACLQEQGEQPWILGQISEREEATEQVVLG
jgi:phosphoribosylaminoimidazole (AIR) synthetase